MNEVDCEKMQLPTLIAHAANKTTDENKFKHGTKFGIYSIKHMLAGYSANKENHPICSFWA